MDVDTLSASQKEALAQLQAIMDGGDADVAISVLDSVNWDVQVSNDCSIIESHFRLRRSRRCMCRVLSEMH